MQQTAILRPPAPTFATGITTASLGQPDYEKAREQHRAYGAALQQCGLELILLDADEHYPDGCFVEDTAIVMEELAILCSPGAASRRGEVAAVAEALAEYRTLATIKPPGEDAYAANCILINSTVLVPAGFPTVQQKIRELSYPIIEVEMSEFRKMDGGLTCLSLVF